MNREFFRLYSKYFILSIVGVLFCSCGNAKKKDSLTKKDKSFHTVLVDSYTITNLVAGFTFGMNKKQYSEHYSKLPKLECDHFRLDLNGTSYWAYIGKPSFYNDELYGFNVYLDYQGQSGVVLSKAEFDTLAVYFKTLYGEDPQCYKFTEEPVSKFPIHEWRKCNLYFKLSLLLESEDQFVIRLEFVNSPVCYAVMKCD